MGSSLIMKTLSNKTAATPSTTGNGMGKFNQTINIEISVDTIHDKLLSEFPEDYKHKGILSHAIIGNALRNGGISYIYNALNGYNNEIDFQIGDLVMCSEQDRYQWEMGPVKVVAVGDAPQINWEKKRMEVGMCEVIGIDLYSPNKLTVQFISACGYKYISDEESYDMTAVNVDHKSCNKLAKEEPVAVVVSN